MESIGLYIHIPFCRQKCLYCDFPSWAGREGQMQMYVDALTAEIRAQGKRYENREVVSVFFGGGTPTALEIPMLAQLMQAIRESFRVTADAELTTEANPGTLSYEMAAALKKMGFNRLSMGVQAWQNSILHRLGRIHTIEEFLENYHAVRQAGFENVNVDLMFALPGQSMAQWQETVRQIAALKPEHISAYSLIIEEGTPFWNRFGEGACACDYTGPALPDEDTENKIYRFTRKFLQEQGFERYEISNYAKPGKECRHNIGYWTEVAYLGLGLGASSYMEGCRFTNEKDLDKYLALDFGEEDPEKRETALRKLWGQIEELSQAQRMEEFMFLGLRMLKGVSDVDFVRLFGVKMETVYGDVIRRLTANGLLKKEENNLALTEWGMDVSNFVLSEFLLG